VTAWSATSVEGNDGYVNSGAGHQFNGPTYFVDAETERLIRRGRDPGSVARDHLVRLHARFVEPGGYAHARAQLAADGCVLLTGRPGVGRRAAGQMLLHGLGGEGPIKDLSDTPDVPGDRVLNPGTVMADDRLLLDLSASDEEPFRQTVRELPTFRAEVRERGASLVVVLPDGPEDQPDPELRPLLATVHRPSGLAVLSRHLRANGVGLDEGLPDTEGLRPYLDSGPMRDLAELALLVGRSSGALSDRLASAIEALTDRTSMVGALVDREGSTGPQRALLLAAGMLSGATADEVHHAAARLLETVGHPKDDRPALEQPGLTQRLSEIRVAADRSGLVRFDQVFYDRAIRSYFWTNFPDLRPRFRMWVNNVVTSNALDAGQRSEFVTRFAEQALRTDRPGDLHTLINGWAEGAGTGGRAVFLPEAATALEFGLTHPRYGGVFRRHVYDWSRRGDLPPQVARLAIEMCAAVIAATHPAEALVRLHHLARRQRGDVRAAAEDALRDLVTRDRRQFRLLLDRVATGLERGFWPRDFDLFLTLAGPAGLVADGGRTRPLVEDPNVHRTLVACWRAALPGRPPDQWTGLVWDWLTAAEDERFRDPLLRVLVDSSADLGAPASRLHVIARDWSRVPEADRATRHRVARRLSDLTDRAQGIAPLASGSGHRTEETTR
jgi:hypothetical protein